MKETLAAFQQGTNEALEAMVANHQELVTGLKVRDNNIKGALARRDEKTDQLEDVVAVLTARIASLQDKTCNCKEGPVLVGQGTANVPFELEYADKVVLPSPNPSSYATPPIENAIPIPTPAPASTLAESNKENCRRCLLQPISQLVKIEDEVMEVDRAEDAPRAMELSRMVTSLVEMRDEGTDIGSTVPTDRSSRRSSFATSFNSQDRIPPRGPTRETAVHSSTMSTALPSNHPVMEMWDQVFSSSVTSGRLIGPLKGISSYWLELVVQLSAEDGDAMFGEVLARRGQHYDLRDGQLMTFRPAPCCYDSLGMRCEEAQGVSCDSVETVRSTRKRWESREQMEKRWEDRNRGPDGMSGSRNDAGVDVTGRMERSCEARPKGEVRKLEIRRLYLGARSGAVEGDRRARRQVNTWLDGVEPDRRRGRVIGT
ncbi:hypothetical protein BJ322DRAFT_1017433 [Thelephora terrestris]|uniref:Uncharacterized protein n=1 Tax=Thelephora terrestris TaxID=56493 RepID=A0A9P6LBJ9_9AGAM|nr:hypothetical protein BJ322DRAFT_1017433 [Thelephora terrestris]